MGFSGTHLDKSIAFARDCVRRVVERRKAREEEARNGSENKPKTEADGMADYDPSDKFIDLAKRFPSV